MATEKQLAFFHELREDAGYTNKIRIEQFTKQGINFTIRKMLYTKRKQAE